MCNKCEQLEKEMAELNDMNEFLESVAKSFSEKYKTMRLDVLKDIVEYGEEITVKGYKLYSLDDIEMAIKE